MNSFEEELRKTVDGRLLVPGDDITRYTVDWTGRWKSTALAVARPRTVDEVVDIVRVCQRHGVSIVPQGGNTGMVGGSVPSERSIVVSTESMTAVGKVSADSTITVGAGLTLSALREVAQSHGFETGLHIASAESATLGGIASTNAGGARVMRYGSARARIAGLRVVTANGDVIDRRQTLPKDNTGYDLVDLFIGAEGTLGIVTDVTWRLVEPNADTVRILFRFGSVDHAATSLPTLRRLPGVEALEWARGQDILRVARHLDAVPPMDTSGFWVFAEVAETERTKRDSGDAGLLTAAEPVIEQIIAEADLGTDDVVVAESANEQRAVWAFRESMSEAISADGVPVKLDVAVPIEHFASVCNDVDAAARSVDPDSRTALFGHLAEANFHISVLPPEGTAQYSEEVADEIEDAVLALILGAGGTISAEHGVGRAKQRWLHRQRGQAQYELMKQIKTSFDPDQLLNPGVLFPDTSIAHNEETPA